MSVGGPRAATITIGSRLTSGGEKLTVLGIEAERLRLRGPDGRTVLMHTATLLADQSTMIEDAGATPIEALGPVLENLTAAQQTQMEGRLAQVRELLTGYASGSAESAVEGEPREQFDPGLPLADRYAAKATELGVSVRTLERWVVAFNEAGPAGLLDRRSLRVSDPLRGVDERWLAMCRTVLAEHTDAARPTQNLVLARVAARLAAEHGAGVVPEPGRRKAHKVLGEIARGTNAFTGSTKGKRSIAARPGGVYGRLRPTRPGEYLLLDTTPLDVFAMEPVTLRWVRVELTIAMDLYSRSITGLRLSPSSTKSVDAALVLFESLRPDSRARTGGGLLPYAGLPDLVVVPTTDDAADSGDDTNDTDTGAGGLVGVAAETVVIDHGRVYLSNHLLGVCARLGISVQPARPLTPTDKAAVERFFRTVREQLLEALPGYTGPDVYSRGADPEGCTYFFIDELESILREWVAGTYHQRPHSGLADPHVPGLDLSPAEMFDHGTTRTGTLRVPARTDLVFDFLPVAWRTIQHYGIEVGGLRYNGPALTPYRNRISGFTGPHTGKWPVRYDTDDVSRIYFQDPADHTWHTLIWEHHTEDAAPFSAEALAYARRLALSSGRHVDSRMALAELLERWDAGLVRHPTERRMAVRASQQRQARLAATGPDPQVANLPALRMITNPGPDPDTEVIGSAQPVSGAGDDDTDDELDVGDEEFYADAFEMLT
ncbi:Helix-turn-helix domain-containing protein [Promicromonospora umidemergens]|uniref:Helix-turn-helix domain-containing protein n=1 Tax=Promicromonospora umidemergens TaxID=629679 RepID=A0ABP8XKQ2_9MICO|nr:Mu transposase C-terminal domain-containing protein [Promicromonospora umidemergens]MCP2284941.1 Helix-turn-helix domain-containing protein [Promicromonospora umidemergens]